MCRYLTTKLRMRSEPALRAGSRGFSLIEVLVTIVVIAVGLLGMAGLQARLHVSEIESYQRAQALLLLNDMSSRISANRRNAVSYVFNDIGAGGCPPPGDTAATDLSEWCNALQGAGEAKGAGLVGAMAGGLGCVENLGGGGAAGQLLLITVAWQGLAPLAAPPASVACGLGQYGDERLRRAVTTVVLFSPL